MNQTNVEATAVEYEVAVGGSAEPAKQTQGQVAMYMKMCRQKRIIPKNIAGLNYEQTSEIIQETILAESGATEKQFATIMEIAERIGIKIGHETLKQLNFKTAGDAIGALIEKEREMRSVLPASEAQIAAIKEMYLCPDVDFTYIDIPNRVSMGKHVVRTKVPNKRIGDEILTWKIIEEEIESHRLLTPDELSNHLSGLTREKASDFYNHFRDAYSAWRKTRISDEQIKTIRTLEKKASDLSGAGRAVETAVTFDGDTMVIGVVKNADRTRRSNTKGYEPLPDHALMQLSYAQASQHIQRIRDELFNFNKYKSASDELNDTTDMRDIHLQRSTNSKEWNDLNNLLHGLLKVAGYQDDTLLQSCLDTTDSDACTEGEAYIKGFMLGMIERGEITMSGLLMMIESSERAMEILFGVKAPKEMKPKHVLAKEKADAEKQVAKDVLPYEVKYDYDEE